MLLGIPRSARCVQRFDDSLNSAIHITFRTFAAFFIDAKAKRSVVESCINFMTLRRARQDMRDKRYYEFSARARKALAPWVHGCLRGVFLSLRRRRPTCADFERVPPRGNPWSLATSQARGLFQSVQSPHCGPLLMVPRLLIIFSLS